MNKSNVISGIVALIVAAIVAYLLGGGQTIIREFGATPGDTVTGNFWNVGGVEFYHADKGVNATTSAMCIFSNPFNATSSIVAFSAKIKGFTAAVTLDVSTSSKSGYTTSTPKLIHAFSIPTTGAEFQWQKGVMSTSSVNTYFPVPDSGISPYFLLPGEFITLKIASSTPGNETIPRGNCSLTLQKM